MPGLPFHPVKPVRGGRPLDGLFTRLLSDPAWVCQAKLNGQRAIWDPTSPAPGGGEGVLWSRREIPIQKAPEVLRALQGVSVPLDGEFVPTKGEDGGVYWVFDLPDHRGLIPDRWAALAALVEKIASPEVIRLCPSSVTWEQVAEFGWEGVVFKRLASKYVKSMRPDNTIPAWVKYRAEWL